MTDTLIGTIVAGHRIERLVGRVGMGVVYEAVELSLDRTVAFKLIAPELAGEPGFRERFMAEAKMAASIDHPNVLPIFNAGEHQGVPAATSRSSSRACRTSCGHRSTR